MCVCVYFMRIFLQVFLSNSKRRKKSLNRIIIFNCTIKLQYTYGLYTHIVQTPNHHNLYEKEENESAIDY